MKKFFFFVAMASVAFVSCLKNEPTFTNKSAEDAQVLFNAPVLSIATKGQEIRGTQFPTDTNFTVFGYYQEGKETYDPAKAQLYMDEVWCTYYEGNVDNGDGEGTWKAEDGSQYYWPKNGKLTFVAVSPAEEDVTQQNCNYSIAATSSKLTINYTSPKELADTSDQADVLYSDWKNDCTASTHESNVDYDGVELAFNHALSVVRLNIRALDKASADAVLVTGLSINNIYESGVFTSEYAKQTEAAWDYTGKNRVNYVIVPSVSDSDMEAATDPTAITGNPARALPHTDADATKPGDFVKFANYILLPQPEFIEGSTIKIEYSIKHWVRNDERNAYEVKWLPQTHVFRLNDSAVHVSKPTTDAEGTAAITEWKKGTRYTYDITIGVKEIYFAPSVADWEDVKVEYNNDAPQYNEENSLYGN